MAAAAAAGCFRVLRARWVVRSPRPPLASSKIFTAVKALSKSLKDTGFAIESGAKLDHTTKTYTPSAVGAKLGVDMGVVVFTNHGADSTKCNIKAKSYSKKALRKCVDGAIAAKKTDL